MPENEPLTKFEKWDGLDNYPKVKLIHWNSDKGFGFCVTEGQKYYLDTRDIYPPLGKENPLTNNDYELHLVSSKSPKRHDQNPSATCVWGTPKDTFLVMPKKSEKGDIFLVSMNKDGTLSDAGGVNLPPNFDLNTLELGAGYEAGVFEGTRMYSSISILGSKKMSIEEVQKEKENKKYTPTINAYNDWLSRNVDFETGRYINTEGGLPENTELKYSNGSWGLKLDGENRKAVIDWFHNRLIIKPVTKRIAERWSESSVDDFGDVGQAVGAGGTRLIGTTSSREIVIKPSREFDLPIEITKVPDENRFNNVPLEKILQVEHLNDPKENIPISYVATDKNGSKIAFWSEKYKCWRKFTDESRKYLDNVKEYDDKHYTNKIKPNDPWIRDFFSMVRMAKLQEMDVNNIAPWLTETND